MPDGACWPGSESELKRREAARGNVMVGGCGLLPLGKSSRDVSIRIYFPQYTNVI